MTTLREAAQQALEALLLCDSKDAGKAMAAITALRAALAQQEQEREDIAQNLQSRLDAALLLEGRRQEITQPRREWRGLTEKEREQATGWSVEHIEAALKEKNNG